MIGDANSSDAPKRISGWHSGLLQLIEETIGAANDGDHNATRHLLAFSSKCLREKLLPPEPLALFVAKEFDRQLLPSTPQPKAKVKVLEALLGSDEEELKKSIGNLATPPGPWFGLPPPRPGRPNNHAFVDEARFLAVQLEIVRERKRSGATGPIQGEEIKNAIGILTLRLQRHQPQTSICTYPDGPYNQERAEQIAEEIRRRCPAQVVSNGDGFDVQWREIDELPGGMTRTFGNAVKKVAAQRNQEQRQSEEWRKRIEKERTASSAAWKEAGRTGCLSVVLSKNYGEWVSGETIRVDSRRAEWLRVNGYAAEVLETAAEASGAAEHYKTDRADPIEADPELRFAWGEQWGEMVIAPIAGK